MSIVDDARRLLLVGPRDEPTDGARPHPSYLVCGGLVGEGHADDCPWPRRRQIVAALESARGGTMIREALVQAGILKPEVLGEDAFPDAQIVRELAERGPFLSHRRANECAFCFADAARPDLADLTNVRVHLPSCLWRRARERYPEAAS